MPSITFSFITNNVQKLEQCMSTCDRKSAGFWKIIKNISFLGWLKGVLLASWHRCFTHARCNIFKGHFIFANQDQVLQTVQCNYVLEIAHIIMSFMFSPGGWRMERWPSAKRDKVRTSEGTDPGSHPWSLQREVPLEGETSILFICIIYILLLSMCGMR